MKDNINATFTLSSFFASEVHLSVKNQAPPISTTELKFDLLTEVQKVENSKTQFFIIYKVSITNKDGSLFLSTNYHAIFTTKDNITEDLLKSEIIRVNAAAIGFPYLRSFITQLTINAGCAPLILPTINFTQFR